jgi:hypothetical protein
MNDTPRRTLVGMFPSGGTEIVAFSNVEATLIADAAARLDAEKAEAERLARQTIVVNREWFLAAMRELILHMESRWALADRRRDYDRRAHVGGKLRRLRDDLDATLRYNDEGPRR